MIVTMRASPSANVAAHQIPSMPAFSPPIAKNSNGTNITESIPNTNALSTDNSPETNPLLSAVKKAEPYVLKPLSIKETAKILNPFTVSSNNALAFSSVP